MDRHETMQTQLKNCLLLYRPLAEELLQISSLVPTILPGYNLFSFIFCLTTKKKLYLA